MAIEILRPNGPGSETSITAQYPASGAHWDKINGAAFDDSREVYTQSQTFVRDLYALQNHAEGSGVITSITIYIAMRSNQAQINAGIAQISQKTGPTVSDGAYFYSPGDSFWHTYSQTFTANPVTGAAYTWAEIDALEVGVSLKNTMFNFTCYCGQVYVAVNYRINISTPALTRVTGLMHYYKRADNIYRLSVNMRGLAPLMMPYLESKTPPSPLTPAPEIPPPPIPGLPNAPSIPDNPSAPPSSATPNAPTVPPALVTPVPPNTAYPSFPNFIPPPVPAVLPPGSSGYAPMLPNYYFPGYDPLKPYYGGGSQSPAPIKLAHYDDDGNFLGFY
jgi:hypothetical protein